MHFVAYGIEHLCVIWRRGLPWLGGVLLPMQTMEVELPVSDDGVGYEDYPMEEDEDEVMGNLVCQGSQMVLGELFEEMADEPHSHFRKPRGSLGWSCDDLGGEGMTVEDFFRQ